jgi:hypothetical protein
MKNGQTFIDQNKRNPLDTTLAYINNYNNKNTFCQSLSFIQSLLLPD